MVGDIEPGGTELGSMIAKTTLISTDYLYCSVMDVRRRIPEMTIDVVSDGDIIVHIKEAMAYIDDSLRRMYIVPFIPVPMAIRGICTRWAAYITLQLHSDIHVEEDLVRMKNDLDRKMEMYMNGMMVLDDAHLLTEPSFMARTITVRPSRYISSRS